MLRKVHISFHFKAFQNNVFLRKLSCTYWKTLLGVFDFAVVLVLPWFSNMQYMQHFNKTMVNGKLYWNDIAKAKKCVHLKFCQTFKTWSAVLFLKYPTYNLWHKVISILWLHSCIVWCGLLQACFVLKLKFTQAPGHGILHHLMSLAFSCLFTAIHKAKQCNIVSVFSHEKHGASVYLAYKKRGVSPWYKEEIPSNESFSTVMAPSRLV